MAVPITNVLISDIVNELGEVTSNITLKNLHRSSKVRGIGIDPAFCDGDNPYQRLYSIQKYPTIGKFRNYEQFNFSYKMGLMYGGNCLYPRAGGLYPTIHIPPGWHVLTIDDWWNILQTIAPGTNFTNNTAGHHLLCNYNRSDIVDFNNLYFSRTGEWLIQPSAFIPIFEDSVNKSDTYGFKAIASSFIDIVGANSIGSSWFCWIYDSTLSGWNLILPCASIRGNLFYPEAITLSTFGYINLEESFDGRACMMSVRLVKNDSNDPGYLEDVEGNIYPTIKIGNTVIMAEGYRCTKDVNGNSMTALTSFGIFPSGPYYYANSLISDMP